MKNITSIIILGCIAFILDGAVLFDGFSNRLAPGDYFMDVGQGESELVVFPDGVKVLTDAGPDDSVVGDLERILPQRDRYIDLAIISYAQLSHYGGFNDLLDHYKIGAFIWNGRDADPANPQWNQLLADIKARNIPILTLLAASSIVSRDGRIDILAPDRAFNASKSMADTSYVERIVSPGLTTLLVSDVSSKVERYLLSHGYDLRADVLKVAHFGSKTSSEVDFLRAVNPKVAVIEVGAGNRYHYPSLETLARVASSTAARIFRTDQSGSVAIIPGVAGLVVRSEK